VIYIYKCNDCGYEFEYPKIIEESHGLDTPPYERFAVCPCCLDTDYDEIIDIEEEDEMEK